MPMLKTLPHFLRRDVAGRSDQLEDRLGREGVHVDGHALSFLEHTRHVLIEAAAGDVAHALDVHFAQQMLDGLHIDLGRGEQLLAQRLSIKRVIALMQVELGVLEQHFADQGEAVGMAAELGRPMSTLPSAIFCPSSRLHLSTAPTQKPAIS